MAAYSGIDLTLMLGGVTPSYAPVELAQAVQSATVTHDDRAGSGFQILFQAGKGAATADGYPLVGNSLLAPFNRVILQVNVLGVSTVLMDGVITHLQLMASGDPSGSLYAVTGLDITVMMDLKQRIATHPALSESVIVGQLLETYSQYGLQPQISDPPYIDTPDPNEYLPVQRASDLAYIRQLAARFGFVFYVCPGSSAGDNVAYWGPPVIDSSPQNAISIDLGPVTNVVDVPAFEYDALAAARYFGSVQDRITDMITSPDIESDDEELPSISANPAVTSQTYFREQLLEITEGRTGGEASARAQALVDDASGRVVSVEGVLDSLRYGAVLKTRALVEVRGGSPDFDGKYYVRRVTHRFERRVYRQEFLITREGLGSTISSVAVGEE